MAVLELSELIAQAPKRARENKTALLQASQCGCYRCAAVFPPATIKEWVPDANDLTALCPGCGIDSVIPETPETGALTKAMLEAAHERWLKTTTESQGPHES